MKTTQVYADYDFVTLKLQLSHKLHSGTVGNLRIQPLRSLGRCPVHGPEKIFFAFFFLILPAIVKNSLAPPGSSHFECFPYVHFCLKSLSNTNIKSDGLTCEVVELKLSFDRNRFES